MTPCSAVVGYQPFSSPCCFRIDLTLKMAAGQTSETLVSYHDIHDITTQKNSNLHRCENFTSPSPLDYRLSGEV